MSDAQGVKAFWDEVAARARKVAEAITYKRRNNVAGQVLRSVLVDSAGHVLDGGAGGGLSLVAVARYATSYLMPNDNGAGDYATERIQFDTVSYDPQGTITTGASWLFTPPDPTAMYVVFASVQVGGSGRNWAVGDYAFLSHNTGGVDIATWRSQGTNSAYITLHCNAFVFDASVTTTFYLNMNVLRTGSGGSGDTSYVPFHIAIFQV